MSVLNQPSGPPPQKPTIPIIGYHEIGGPPEFNGGLRYDVHGLNISPDDFRSELKLLDEGGYYPVSLNSLLRRQVHVPKGKRPIILTFDDGRASQFKYLAKKRIDPDCAVGILLTFHHLHPEWPLRGSFFIIAGSDQNGVPFDQEGMEQWKMRQLVKWGFEIGNHSLTHPSFKNLSKPELIQQIDGCDRYLKKLLPHIKVDTLALPYGDLPKKPELRPLLRAAPGKSYLNHGILLFSGGLCPYPKFDPYLIPRISPEPKYLRALLIDKLPTK